MFKFTAATTEKESSNTSLVKADCQHKEHAELGKHEQKFLVNIHGNLIDLLW